MSVARTVVMVRRALAALAVTGLLVACGSSSEDVDQSDQDVTALGITAKASDPCEATLVFLQKDAYVSRGRTQDYWPPHTTTVLEVTCQTARGEQHIEPYRNNFGTKPGTKDANGNDILTRIDMDPNVVTTKAPWREMKKLVTSYEDCGCDPKGFFGLDTIDVEGKGLLESLTPILSCPDSNDALLKALKEKRFDDAKQMVARCELRSDVTAEELAKTAGEVEAQVKKLYFDHHVCNNSALMQADLFARFRDHDDATACDAASKTFCAGPKLFFNPKKEVR